MHAPVALLTFHHGNFPVYTLVEESQVDNCHEEKFREQINSMPCSLQDIFETISFDILLSSSFSVLTKGQN